MPAAARTGRQAARSWGVTWPDDLQGAVVTDHDSRVIARRRVRRLAFISFLRAHEEQPSVPRISY
jgi:hypothetical protein